MINPNMNNLGSIDYTISEWLDDNDHCISRKGAEFPRITSFYNNKFDKEKPWGQHDPVLFDPMEDPFLQKDEVKTGIWYYGGIPVSDHLDLCGMPELLSPLRKALGIEYRYEVWRKIYIRLRLLEFKTK